MCPLACRRTQVWTTFPWPWSLVRSITLSPPCTPSRIRTRRWHRLSWSAANASHIVGKPVFFLMFMICVFVGFWGILLGYWVKNNWNWLVAKPLWVARSMLEQSLSLVQIVRPNKQTSFVFSIAKSVNKRNVYLKSTFVYLNIRSYVDKRGI